MLKTEECQSCTRASKLLRSINVAVHEVDIEGTADGMDFFSFVSEKEHHPTVPMIWIGGKFVGGLNELMRIHRNDRLIPMLKGQ